MTFAEEILSFIRTDDAPIEDEELALRLVSL